MIIDNLGTLKSYPVVNNKILNFSEDLKFNVDFISRVNVDKFYAVLGEVLAAEFSVAVTLDPDMHGNLEDIPVFYKEVLKGKKLIFGCRINRSDVSYLRFVFSRSFNFIIKKLFNLPVSDLNTPMIMISSDFRSKIIESLTFGLEPKIYLPYTYAHLFSEIPIRVITTKKSRSSYSWFSLSKQALKQFFIAYRFFKYTKRKNLNK